MKPIITGFSKPIDRGQALARDIIPRWALEEVGQPYEMRLITMPQMKEPAHRALNPFGSIPTYEQDDVALFESGAIALHIAEKYGTLISKDEAQRARTISWMFTSYSVMDSLIMEFSMSALFEKDKPWFAERQEGLRAKVKMRLTDLTNALGSNEWLMGTFTAADIVMIAALRRLKSSGLLTEFPLIGAYVARGEARPAFKRAFDAAYAIFEAASK